MACGKNDYGQLGVDKGDAHKRMTQVSGALDAERVSSLKCGYYHTIALCERGRVFGFGRNDYGQLGLGNEMGAHGGQTANSQRVLGPQLIEGES
jgi:alpha-tubulin suppressor-like RCC1 family protein